MEKFSARRHETAAGPQIVVMAMDDGRRQKSFGKQAVRSIQVGQNRVQQARALLHGPREKMPLFSAYDQRQKIDLPKTVGSLGIGIDIVSYAVLLVGAADRVRVSLRLSQALPRHCLS